jgi:hypothetical protein
VVVLAHLVKVMLVVLDAMSPVNLKAVAVAVALVRQVVTAKVVLVVLVEQD